MKKLIAIITLSFATGAFAAAETKEVCVDVKDNAGKVVNDPKTGKPKQSCKTIKVHKKVEGTKVPDGKK